jgi:site-specific recombinase XerD
MANGFEVLERTRQMFMSDAADNNTQEGRHEHRAMAADTSVLTKRAREFLTMLNETNVLGDSPAARTDPQLLKRARIALAQGLAMGSLNAYMSAWRNFVRWCKQKDVPWANPSESTLTLYVFDRATAPRSEGGLKYVTLKNYLYGIGHYLGAGGRTVDLLSKYPLLDRMMQRIHRLHGEGHQDQRQPIYWWMLVKISESGNVVNVTDQNMLALAFLCREGLYRVGELTAESRESNDYPRLEDWTFDSENQSAALVLKQSKTNPWRERILVHHPITADPFCAAKYLSEIVTRRQNSLPTQPLFQDSRGNAIRRKEFTAWLSKALERVGISSPNYKGHSLRIGGATELAELGVADHMIQAMGRWRSSCYTLYRRASMTDKLSVTKLVYAKSKPQTGIQ